MNLISEHFTCWLCSILCQPLPCQPLPASLLFFFNHLRLFITSSMLICVSEEGVSEGWCECLEWFSWHVYMQTSLMLSVTAFCYPFVFPFVHREEKSGIGLNAMPCLLARECTWKLCLISTPYLCGCPLVACEGIKKESILWCQSTLIISSVTVMSFSK